ncbi:MAG: T9SS type A sorting domain-containing protein, partial [Ignavibacterium sp.]|nr:T9SS type A sorting domain-containing protein [Ignavibacterium sp.]
LQFSFTYPQVPYNLTPNWISTDVTSRTTGGMFADINQDGWLDYVVANGNDMARQRVAVYYNTGTGTFPTTPNWQSTDIDYHGHLDVGDVNGDGYPDVAVSVYLGANGFSSRGKVKLYLNNNGTLSSNPSWTSSDNFYSFSCAFGDANGDGRLDLAVACGESYYNYPEQQRIYLNIGGTLENLPSWKSTASFYSYDVNWFDMDNDGDLDLVFGNEGFPNYVFRNNNGNITTTPVWQSTDASMQANSLFIGDVNKDGFLDLAISDNNQLGGSGRFKIYLNNNGMLNTTPFWNSDFNGYGSGILLADVDFDNDLDLITGAWWSPIRIYLNNNGNFNTLPQYTSNTNSVVEAIFCGDVNKDGLQNITKTFIGNGIRKLFYLSDMHLQFINRVIVGNDTLPKNQYCYDLENGWISFANPPLSGMQILIETAKSISLDLGVTNWDSNIGNYLFTSQIIPVELSSFSALLSDNKVYLKWTTITETNNLGFEIERSQKSIQEITGQNNNYQLNWEKIGFVEGNGTTTEINNYFFIDNLSNTFTHNLSNTLYYRLKQIDLDGSYTYSKVLEVKIKSSKEFSLQQNYPNPLNSSTRISWQSPINGWHTIKLFDLLGKEVETIVEGFYESGYHSTLYIINSSLPSGVYFYQLKVGDYIQTKKLIFVK